MVADRPFAGAPEDSREAIMRATFVALQRHGYAGLSIQRIADQADLSKSTFYHHFDDKEDLMLSFAEYTLRQFMTVLSLEASDDPRETLERLVAIVVTEDFPSIEDAQGTELDEGDILGAYVELRAQAVKNDSFRAAFTELDDRLRSQIADIVRDGIESGAFRDVNAEAVATMILSVLGGHMFGAATRREVQADTVRGELEFYIRNRLVAPS